jgi:hypothetical protein
MAIFMIMCHYFLDLTHFRGLGQKFIQTSLKIFKHYKLKPSFSIIKDEKAKDKVGVRDKPPHPSFNNLIQFDPIYSNLIKFDPIHSTLFQFDPI